MKVRYSLKIICILTVVIFVYSGAILLPIYYAGDIAFLTSLHGWSSIIAIIPAGIALITAILALFKDFILDFINAPTLDIQFSPKDRRDCHTTTFRNIDTGEVVARTHYFRIRIKNDGRITSEDVEVTLEKVEKYQNNRFEIDQDFMPLRLFWSHWRERRFELSIPSGTYRHCDFGFIIDPNAKYAPLPPQENSNLLFWFDVFLRPNTGRTSLLPGRYKVTVSVFGKNSKGKSLTLDMEWKGVWSENIEEMLSKGIIFR